MYFLPANYLLEAQVISCPYTWLKRKMEDSKSLEQLNTKILIRLKCKIWRGKNGSGVKWQFHKPFLMLYKINQTQNKYAFIYHFF